MSDGGSPDLQHPSRFAATAPDRPAVIVGDRRGPHLRRARGPVEPGRPPAAPRRPRRRRPRRHPAREPRRVLRGRVGRRCASGCYVTPDQLAPRARRGRVHRRGLRRRRRSFASAACATRSTASRPIGALTARFAVGGDAARVRATTRPSLAAQPGHADRRRVRGQLDVLLVGHHGPARRASSRRRSAAARRADRVRDARAGPLRRRRGLGLPEPGAAVPRGPVGLDDRGPPPRRHRRS